MALSQHLVQKQTQKLIITQDLRQSIELLPLSNIELSERIQNELVENPLLDEGPEIETEGEQLPSQKKESATEDVEAEDSWKSGSQTQEYEFPSYGSEERMERKHQFLQNALTTHESLADHLSWQIRVSSLSEEEIRAGEIIVSAIDSRGFLTEKIEDLIQGSSISIRSAKRALRQIYNCDPIGCGAQGIQETLMIQAQILKPYDEVTQDLLKNYFQDIEKLDYKKIEKSTGYTREQIEDSIQFIRTLEPYPGTLYAPRHPEYIVPDLAVIEMEGKQEVIINDEFLPNLRVNESYKNILKEKGKEQDREYLQAKLNSAVWLIKSIKQRRQTLYRVMKAIVEAQEHFFQNGSGNLRPLTLREIAEKVELHESTVSRITTNKFVQTRWGVFELKYFFSSSLKSSSGGESHSATSIQDRIKQIIAAEDQENPLSDQDIVELFKKEEVQIARRTVAKYRKILRILPADRRKKLNKLKEKKN